MYRRILTSLTVIVALGIAVVPVATAGQSQQALIRSQLGEIGAWAVPSNSPVVSKPLSTRAQLGEIGAWAVPSTQQTAPSKPLVSEKLDGLGLGEPTTTTVASSSNGFDWNDAGIGAAIVFGTLLIGAGSLVTIRRHHRPIPH